MKCPRCCDESKLIVRQFWDVEVDHCPKCYGIWLDLGEMNSLIERFSDNDQYTIYAHEAHSITLGTSRVKGVCPRDNSGLKACHIPGPSKIARSVLDVCPKCMGIWVDGTELMDVHHILMENKQLGYDSKVEVEMDASVWRRLFVPSFISKLIRRK